MICHPVNEIGSPSASARVPRSKMLSYSALRKMLVIESRRNGGVLRVKSFDSMIDK